MPPTKKRRNVSSSDSSEPYSKGVRTDGGRRGIASPPRGDAGNSDISPALIAQAASSALQVRSGATRVKAAREKKYLDGMAKLNYQLYRAAKGILESGEAVPNDGFYTGMVENYLFHCDELKHRFKRSYGDIVVFGSGDCGQLGCGEAVTESRKPKILHNLRGKQINMVASGGLHTLALEEDGAVYSWGCNDEGCLGWQTTVDNDEGALPSRVQGFHPSAYGPNGAKAGGVRDGSGKIVPFEQRKEAAITQVATGETHSLALSAAGDVYMWGALKDNEGRKFRGLPPRDDTRVATGNQDMSKLEEDDKPEWFHPPRGNQDWPSHCVEVPLRAKAISAGGSFNAALLKDDTLVTWGIGICGELARPVPELTKKTPNAVVLEDYLKPKPPIWEQPSTKRTVVSMSCGEFHFLVISREEGGHNVYSSGLNQYGQLGHGDIEKREKLTKIEALEEHDITKIGAKGHFSCFVDRTGRTLYECGRGDYGQLGITLEQPDPGYYEPLPIRVPLVYEPQGAVTKPKENIIKTEDIVEEDQPEIMQISCGSSHVLAVVKGGDAYSWGFGTSGACGQAGEDSDVLRPKMIKMKSKIQYVSGGGQHSTAIVKTDAGFAT